MRAPAITYNGLQSIRWDQARNPSASQDDVSVDWTPFNAIQSISFSQSLQSYQQSE